MQQLWITLRSIRNVVTWSEEVNCLLSNDGGSMQAVIQKSSLSPSPIVIYQPFPIICFCWSSRWYHHRLKRMKRKIKIHYLTLFIDANAGPKRGCSCNRDWIQVGSFACTDGFAYLWSSRQIQAWSPRCLIARPKKGLTTFYSKSS